VRTNFELLLKSKTVDRKTFLKTTALASGSLLAGKLGSQAEAAEQGCRPSRF
jgi:hypothetical protein